MAFVNIADGEKIAQRLGHFLFVDIHESVVDPVFDRRFPRRTAGLGDFIFVMREDQVFAAAMNVEGFAEIFLAHRGTLDMPSWATRPPGAVPCRLLWLAFFPQRKIQRIAFGLVDLDAGAC